jgi:putative ABC transport system permease protein
MDWFRVAWSRLLGFTHRDRFEREFEQELASHLDMATEDNLKRGMNAEEARREALLSLGGLNVTLERHREARGLPVLEAALQDVRYTVRMLRREPAFFTAAVLVMGLGIGANTAIFSVVDGVLLRPAPLEQIERLSMVWETDRHSGTTREPASVPDFLDFRTRSRSFERLAAWTGGEVNLNPPAGEPVRLVALRITHDLLPMLGITPVIGRSFTPADDAIGAAGVVLISESLWERSFGRDPAVIGEVLRLDERAHTIVGVVPDQADFGVLQVLSEAAYSRSFADRGGRTRVDVWAPLQPDPERLPRASHSVFLVGRLLPASTPGSAQQELKAIASDLERSYRSNDGRGAFVEPLAEVIFGPARPALYVLWGAVGLVLLIACVNVTNLLLARGTARVREVAVRAALGGGRGRLARQFLVEGLVLTLLSTSVGLLLAHAGLRALLALAPADIPRVSLVTIDLPVLVTTLGISIVVGLAFGMVPTLQARRIDLQYALKGQGGSRASVGPARHRLRSALVVAEVALAVVLVAGAGLLIRSFWHLQGVDPGFRVQGVLKAEYQLPAARYPADFAAWPNFKEMHAFTDALLRRAARLPGVDSAALAGDHPLDPGFTNSFDIVGRETEARSWPEISIRRVTPGYFRTVQLPLRRGRLLRDSDGTFAAPVVLINEAAARRFFPQGDPLGAQMRFWGAARTIVGVVADERFRGLAEAPPLGAYVPLAQTPSADGAGVLLVRTTGDPAGQTSAVRGAIREQDPELAVFGVEPLEETLSRSIAERRFMMLLLGLFAAVALVLAAVGIHGVLSFGVARRTREIGLRIALGAHPRQLLRLIIKEGLALAIAGMTLGLAGALALTRLLASLLFGVTPRDPATFVAVALFLAAVAVAASYLPARRATKVDPAVALRTE